MGGVSVYERSELIITPPFPHDATTSTTTTTTTTTLLFANHHDHHNDHDDETEEKPIKNPISKLLELVRNIMPGADITRLQVRVPFQ